MRMRYIPLISVLAIPLMGADGCVTDESGTKYAQAEKAAAAANSIHFTENSEIDNIKARLELTANPGLLGYIALINKVGQVILYTPVKGKITSGSKRLTPPSKEWVTVGQTNPLGPAPSDEGTWGESNPYIYFWTPVGQYIQTSLEYVYSDKPFRLKEEPLMLTQEIK